MIFACLNRGIILDFKLSAFKCFGYCAVIIYEFIYLIPTNKLITSSLNIKHTGKNNRNHRTKICTKLILIIKSR